MSGLRTEEITSIEGSPELIFVANALGRGRLGSPTSEGVMLCSCWDGSDESIFRIEEPEVVE